MLFAHARTGVGGNYPGYGGRISQRKECLELHVHLEDFRAVRQPGLGKLREALLLLLSKSRSEKEGELEARETMGSQPSGKESSRVLSFTQDQDETHQRGRTAIILNGPPVPLAIFMGRAITSKLFSGRARRSARFSNSGTLCESNATCDSNFVDWP